MKKRIALLLLSALLCGSVSACGGSSSGGAGADQAAEKADEKPSAGSEKKEENDSERSVADEAASQGADSANTEDSGEGNTVPGDVDPADNAPLSEIYTKIQSITELKSPVEMPESFLANTYGVDPAILDDFLLVVSEDAASAETIAILKARDDASLEACRSALEVLIKEKAMEMENYIPEQYKLVFDSSVQTRGRVAYLVISENARDIIGTIEECIP